MYRIILTLIITTIPTLANSINVNQFCTNVPSMDQIEVISELNYPNKKKEILVISCQKNNCNILLQKQDKPIDIINTNLFSTSGKFISADEYSISYGFRNYLISFKDQSVTFSNKLNKEWARGKCAL